MCNFQLIVFLYFYSEVAVYDFVKNQPVDYVKIAKIESDYIKSKQRYKLKYDVEDFYKVIYYLNKHIFNKHIIEQRYRKSRQK